MATVEQMKAALDELRRQNNILACANEALQGEINTLKEIPAVPPGEVDPRVAELEAENETLKAQIVDSVGEIGDQNKILAAENDRLKTALDDVKDRLMGCQEEFQTLKKSKGGEGLGYPLQPYREGSTCSFYEQAEPHGFVYQERLSFRDDMGYDASVVVSRALEAIKRGVGSDSADRMGARCENLPLFHKERYIEVTIRIV